MHIWIENDMFFQQQNGSEKKYFLICGTIRLLNLLVECCILLRCYTFHISTIWCVKQFSNLGAVFRRFCSLKIFWFFLYFMIFFLRDWLCLSCLMSDLLNNSCLIELEMENFYGFSCLVCFNSDVFFDSFWFVRVFGGFSVSWVEF